MKQELILLWASNDLDAVTTTDSQISTRKPKIRIEKIYWQVLLVSVDISQQLSLIKMLNKNIEIPLYIRSWEILEFPSIPESSRHSLAVKTTTKL